MSLLLLSIISMFTTNHYTFAEAGLEAIYHDEPGNYLEFREELKSRVNFVDAQLQRSKSLKIAPIQWNSKNEVSFDDCVKLSEKISSAYLFSPFKFSGVGFSSLYSLCVLDAELPEAYQSHQGMRYFFEIKAERTYLGHSAAQNLVIEKSLNLYPYVPTRSIYLLSENFRVLEIRTEVYEAGKKHAFEKLHSRSIEGLDEVGNYYLKSEAEKHQTKPWNIYKFTSFDGVYNDNIKTERYGKNGTGHENQWIESTLYSIAPKKDWKAVFMPLTLAWSGARFEYESGFYPISKNRDFLKIIKFKGSEICSEGDRRAFDKWYYYIAPGQKRYECFNDW